MPRVSLAGVPLIRPKLLPDEHVCSYLGAVMRMNGIASEKVLRELLRQPLTRWGKRVVTDIFLVLAAMSDTEPFELAKLHSTLPLVAPYLHNMFRGRFHMALNAPARQEVCFCSECVHSDIQSIGRSYWKCSHQMPGLLWCLRHETPLLYVRGRRAFDYSPSQFSEIAERFDVRWVEEVRRNASVERFLRTSSRCVEKWTRFNSCAHHFGDRFVAGEVSAGNRAEFSDISFIGLVKDGLKSFPDGWLASVLPETQGDVDLFLDQVSRLEVAAERRRLALYHLVLFSALGPSMDF